MLIGVVSGSAMLAGVAFVYWPAALIVGGAAGAAASMLAETGDAE